MENRISQGKTPTLSRSHSSKKPKFKELPLDDYNELNSKYELYKRGSPNSYAQDINALKVRNIRNYVTTTELSAVEAILNQLGQTQSQAQINQRNYDLYPNLLKQPKARYKEMLSEKQEINDFVLWFQGQMMAIDKSSDPFARKFQNKQTLIAAGFTQMVTNVAKVSKNRAEILKMLWNRQNEEVSRIIDALNGQSVKKERTLLQQISKLHQQYQNQIDNLRNSDQELEESLDKEKKFNRTLIENLRILRKRMKKLEYLVKKLSQSNASTKRQNLNLIEQNIKLLMSIRQISEEEAVILNYRRLQVYQQKQRLKKHKIKKILQLAEVKEEGLAPIQQLEEKKKALYDFFLQRLKENPDEKIFIKQEYFTDEEENVVSIDNHFKNIINRSHIKMQLLNEEFPQLQQKDRAVNTDFLEQISPSITNLCLQKGIQVHIVDLSPLRDDSENLLQRKLYQMMGQRQQEQLQKQSKKRIIQHRLSRKNSLTLLEIQGLTQATAGKGFAKKNAFFSSFGKNNRSGDIIQEEHNKNLENDSQMQSQESQAESQNQILAINKLGKSQLTAITIPTNIVNQRKSIVFNNLLQKINDTYERKSNDQLTEEQAVTKQLIRLDEEQQEEIKYTQLEDLIKKHLMKHEQGKTVQKPQKYLNKLLLSLYRNVSMTKRYNFVFELLQVIRNSYGNNKSIIWKFLNITTVIKSHSNTNSLLKIVSIFLKINDQFATYSEVNRQELQQLYFKLFLLLSIRTINQSSFNLWKASTSLERIKSLEFLAILQQFFSRKKRSYVENKIEEMVIAAQQEGRKGSPSTFNKIDIQEDNAQIVKLNPILLYILEVYLIEKETYHASYKLMLGFASSDGHLSAELLVWLIDFMAFDEQRQNQMISFLCKETDSEDVRNIKNDHFYRFCLKFDLPLFEELAVATYGRFKQLPQKLQQRYFRMNGIEQWNAIRQELTSNYSKSSHSQIYFKAFILILDKLEAQIKRGASIYGEEGQPSTKRKEQVFSLFYKIAIIEAHKHTLQDNKNNDHRYVQSNV